MSANGQGWKSWNHFGGAFLNALFCFTWRWIFRILRHIIDATFIIVAEEHIEFSTQSHMIDCCVGLGCKWLTTTVVILVSVGLPATNQGENLYNK